MVIFPEPKDNRDPEQAEQKRYRWAKRQGGWESVAEEANCVATEYFKSGQSKFHTRTMDLLGEVFGSQREVFQRCYFTELTKCQQVVDRVPGPTRRCCLELYLRRELEIVQPKAALLFGMVKDYQGRIKEILEPLGGDFSGEITVLAHHPSRTPLWIRKNPSGQADRARIKGKLRQLLSLS